MPNPNPHHVLDRMLDEFAVRLAASTAASKDPEEIVKAPRQIEAAFEIDGGLSAKMTLEIWETGDDQKPVPTNVPETPTQRTDPMPDPTPPTDLAARREAENRLAETPIGKALFEYIKTHDNAWQQDGYLGAREHNSQRQLTQVRQLFELADLRRRALVQLLLDAITPAAKQPDPTYQREVIDATPAWKLAFYLSELDNDNAPIGWGNYIRLATVLNSCAAVTPRGEPAATPPEEPNIVRMLDVSTAHLPAADRSDLVVGDLPGQTVATIYGGIINAATWLPENDGPPPDGASKALNAVMRHALARNCQYVMFDADAPGLDGFPTFDED